MSAVVRQDQRPKFSVYSHNACVMLFSSVLPGLCRDNVYESSYFEAVSIFV